MALMTSMRNRMQVVLWAVLALFILSMTVGGLVGGADILDQIFNRADPSKVIARINGQDVSPQYFNQLVSQNLDNLRANGQQITDRNIEQARRQSWENLVQEVLVGQQVDELGLTASDEEVVFHLLNNPPLFLQSNPSFMTDGNFDFSKYQEAIRNPQGNEWAPIESFMKNNYLPNYKLQQFLTAAVVVTPEDVKNDYSRSNINYSINGIHVTRTAVSESIEKPTTEEVSAYYNENKEDFDRGALRDLRLAVWAKEPSKDDTLKIESLANDILSRAKNGENFASLAAEYSQDPGSQNNGGELGWFGKGRMVKPFEEAAFNAKKGDIIGPVKSRFGYHIIHVKDTKTVDKKPEVNAAHILLSFEISAMTLDQLKQASTLFSYDAQDHGFDTAIDSHKVEPISAKSIKEDASFLPKVGSLRSAVRFGFNNPVGSASTVFETDRHFVVVTVDSAIQAGIAPLSDVEQDIIRTLSTEKENAIAEERAAEFLIDATSVGSLSKVINDLRDYEPILEDSKPLARGFNSIGRSHPLIGALLTASPGDLIGPVETQRGYAVVEYLEKAEFDSTDFAVQKDKIYTDLLNKKQTDFFQAWLTELKENAEIIDNRKYYF